MRNILLAIVLVAGISSQVCGATKYWDLNSNTAGSGANGTTATWNTATANWTTDLDGSSATTTWAAGDTAVFSAGTDATGAYTVDVSGTQAAAGLIIEEGTITMSSAGVADVGTGTVTLNSGTRLIINNSARVGVAAGGKFLINGPAALQNTVGTSAGSFVDADATIALAGNLTVEYQVANSLSIIQTASIISGTGDLIKTGDGVIAIASPSTYIGDTIINAGELRLRSATNRLPTSTNVTVNGPGILNVNGSGQNQTVASLSGDGTVGLANGTLTISGTTSTTFSGVIADTANAGAAGATTTGGNITKNLASQLTLTGANTFTGTLTIGSTAGNSVSVGNGGTTGSIAGNVATTSNGGLIFNRSDDSSYSRLVSGAGTVTKLGSGVLTINGFDWTNTGGVVINGGTIKFGNSAAGFATTVPVTINNTGAMDMNSVNDTFGSLVSAAGNTTGELKLTGNLSLGQTATTARAYGGIITGGGTLTKAGGTWTQTLSGDNSAYTGNILINLGKIAVGNKDALGTTGGTTAVASGAELLFDGAANSFTISEPISIAGVGADGGAIAVQNASTMIFDGPITLTADATVTTSSSATSTYSNANAFTGNNFSLTVQGGSGAGDGGTISGQIALGTGGLTKLQGGTWVLSNPAGNNYSGVTAINAGTLAVTNTTGSGTGSSDITIGTGTTGGTLNVGTGGTGGTISGNISFDNTSGSSIVNFDRSDDSAYAGKISGANGAVNKRGAGTLTLSGNNSHGGGTKLFDGGLALGHKNAVGNSTFTIGDATTTTTLDISATTDLSGANAISTTTSIERDFTVSGSNKLELSTAILLGSADRTITVINTDDTIFSATISGSGGLIKEGAGSLILSGDALYDGTTKINNGLLQIDGNKSGLGSVVVKAGGTLGGNGLISGGVIVDGGSLAAGASIGVLNITGDLNLMSGAVDWEFNTAGGGDVTNVLGALSIDAAVMLVGSRTGALYAPYLTKYTVISYSEAGGPGMFSGLPENDYVVLDGQPFFIHYDDPTPGGNGGLYTHNVTLTAVPEASSIFALGLGGVFAIGAVWLGRRYGVTLKV